ncbi:MAG TPA: alpha/beta hydrolase [Smithellaceae bacterium]|nr:alpha/beta hydrolase [Smithellaceae bacterium]
MATRFKIFNGEKRLLLHIKVENLAVDKEQPAKIKFPTPLLFIHGAGITSKYLANYLGYFARTGWESYAINLRGHKPSSREEGLAGVTIEDYIDDIKKVIVALRLENCALIGHSMGGLLALKVASQMESIRALVTIASAPPLGVPMEMKMNLPYSGMIIKSMWGMMNFKPVKPTFFMAGKTLLNNIPEKERKDIYSLLVAESIVAGYQVSQGVPVNMQNIKCPKLVIGCRKDVMAPEEMERHLADCLNADYIAYEQFAHLPMLEEGWEKSAADIRNWLIANIPERRRGKDCL